MRVAKTALIAALTGLLVSGAALAQDGKDSRDATLAAEIKQHLSHSVLARDIANRVQVIDGVTYLHGRVDTPYEVFEAEAIVGALPGVTKVVNNLEYAVQ